ncbi:MAG TPA: tyrosine-protein phosphatase [Jatrophihabitans sp.]|nr:tyrosine-protein phosphatase [Jatrophihabitans sp.]
MTSYAPNWIELEGVVNIRDVGGLPAADGRRIRHGVLIRSANLSFVTEADVARLVNELRVRRVLDLRTDVEVRNSEPGLLRGTEGVTFHHLSLYPDGKSEAEAERTAQAEAEAERTAQAEAEAEKTPDPVAPWAGEEYPPGRDRQVVSYLRYLERRPDSIVAALRAISEPDGATVVHCAAGKDRTGMVIALALSVAGVAPEVIAADYAETQSQIVAIIEQLAGIDLYDLSVAEPEKVPPAAAETMLGVLAAIDTDHGGVLTWLAEHGWTERDSERLRTTLLD